MESDQLIQIIEQAGYEPRSYSGRGMYGKECLGVSCDSPVQFVLDVVKEVYASTGDLGDILDDLYNYRTDQLGLRSIIYFPRIEWESEPADEGEEN